MDPDSTIWMKLKFINYPRESSLKFKSLIAAAVIAVSALNANAAPTSFTQVSGSFNDTLLGSINIPTLSNVAGGLGYILNFKIFGTNFNMPVVTFTGVSLGVQTATADALNNFTFSGLAAGNYDLKVTGSVAGGGSNFIQAQYTVTAVPEPETYDMLLAGLGLMGAIARRRNKAGSV